MPVLLLQNPPEWRRLIYFFLLLFAVTLTLPAEAQKLSRAQRLNKNKLSRQNQPPLTAGNKIYRIAIEDIIGGGVGQYAVTTGPRHPVSRRQPVVDHVGILGSIAKRAPFTSYTSIRSYTSGRDYVQAELTPVNNQIVWLDSVFISDKSILDRDSYLQLLNNGRPIKKGEDTTGFIIKYALPGLARVPDSLLITEKIEVHGTDFDDSWVEITTMVKNTGNKLVSIGIRYLWDLNVGGDDGPDVSESVFGLSFDKREASFGQPDFAFFIARPNDDTTITSRPRSTRKYQVIGSVLTPAALLRTPLQPTLLKQVSWPLASRTAFNYEDSSRVVTTTADLQAGAFGGDSAILYFWGDNPENRIFLFPGDSIKVTQALLASVLEALPPLFDRRPPACDLAAVNPGPPKSFEFVVQDHNSGIRSLRVHNSFNVNVEIPRFPTAFTEPITVTGTVIDETKPFGFTLRTFDLCGNEVLCDPVFLTLLPGLRTSSQEFELLPSDRYLYIKNQGIRRIVANLNGYEFIVSTSKPVGPYFPNNYYVMPAHGEMTLDMIRYMKDEANTMSIAFDGPEDSRGDLVISDMIMKSNVDVVLNLSPVPEKFALSQNLPNPFQGATSIRFEVPALASNSSGTEKVELRIYNLLGQLVRTVVDANLPTGSSYTARWNGRDEAGRLVAAGLYIYSLQAGNGTRLTKKMALIR
jgi:hypothetical protein